MTSFSAVVIEDAGDKQTTTAIKQLTLDDLPRREVLIEVAYSSLNYKDGLAVAGRGIARQLPMVAGIDLVGTIVASDAPEWHSGDQVIVNGWGLSETTWGGYARFARVDASWLVPLPSAFSLEQAAAIGTAGYTAGLCVEALEGWGVTPGDGEVFVTGAAGGVGSVAIALLAARGYTVVASSGRPEASDYLERLGASRVIDRASLSVPGRPLQRELWAGVVDSVGSTTLANVLAQTAYGGAVAACGLAGGADLSATVMPHILRSVALLGIDSVMAPRAKREAAWARLARDLDPTLLAAMTSIEPMSRIVELADAILAGQTRGRVVIDVTA